MSSQNNHKPDYVMKLIFSPDQITEALTYELYPVIQDNSSEITLGDQCSPEGFGPCAGTYHFKRGDKIRVDLICNVKTPDKLNQRPGINLDVKTFTIVSIGPNTQKYLSLFEKEHACITLTDWTELKPVRNKKNKDFISAIYESKDYMHVKAENGHWKMSGYLSVLIDVKHPGKKRERTARLFYFDPESTAGSGGIEP